MIIDELILKISGDIEALKSKLNQVEKEAENAGKKSGVSFSTAFNATVGAILSSAAFQKVYSIFSNAINASIAYERNLRSLQATARAANIDFEQLNSVVQRLGSDGVLSIDQATVAVKALVAQGIQINEAFDLLDAAKKVGFFNNIVGDTGQAVLDFVKFIQTGSAELAENLDPSLISVIKSLGGYAKVSQNAEAKQKLLNAVIEKGKTFNEAYDQSIAGVEKSLRDFSQAQTQLYQLLGEGLKELFAPIMGVLADLAKSIVAFIKDLTPASRAVLAVGAAIAGLLPVIATVLPMLKLFAVAFTASLGPISLVVAAIAALTAGIIYFIQAKARQQLKEETDEYIRLRNSIGLTADEQQRLNALKTKFAQDEKYLKYLQKENATLAEQIDLLERRRRAEQRGGKVEEEAVFEALSPEERLAILQSYRAEVSYYQNKSNKKSKSKGNQNEFLAALNMQSSAIGTGLRAEEKTTQLGGGYVAISRTAKTLTKQDLEIGGGSDSEILRRAFQQASVERVNTQVLLGLLEDWEKTAGGIQKSQVSIATSATKSTKVLKDTFFELKKELRSLEKDFAEVAESVSKKYVPQIANIDKQIKTLEKTKANTAERKAAIEAEMAALKNQKEAILQARQDELEKEKELYLKYVNDAVSERRKIIARYLEDEYLAEQINIKQEYDAALEALENLNNAKLINQESYEKTRLELVNKYAKKELEVKLNYAQKAARAAEQLTKSSLSTFEAIQNRDIGGAVQGFGGMLSNVPGPVGVAGGIIASVGSIFSAITDFNRKRAEEQARREQERKRAEEERHRQTIALLREQAEYQKTLVEQNIKKDDLFDAQVERQLRIFDLESLRRKTELTRQLRVGEITQEQFEKLTKQVELETSGRKREVIESDLRRKTAGLGLPEDVTRISDFITGAEQTRFQAENVLNLLGYAKGDSIGRRSEIIEIAKIAQNQFGGAFGEQANRLRTLIGSAAYFESLINQANQMKIPERVWYNPLTWAANAAAKQMQNQLRSTGQGGLENVRRELEVVLSQLEGGLQNLISRSNLQLNVANDSVSYLERIAELNNQQENLLLDISKTNKEIAINTSPDEKDKSIFSIFGGFIQSAGFVKAVTNSTLPAIVQTVSVQSETVRNVNELIYETVAEHLEVAKEQLYALKDIYAVLDNNSSTQGRIFTAEEYARGYAEFRRRAIRG